MGKRLLMAAFILSGLFLGQAAGEEIAIGLSRPHGMNEIAGTQVKDGEGDPVGRIIDFVIDPQGHVIFAILSQELEGLGERPLAIPFDAMTYDQGRRVFVLNISKEKLLAMSSFSAQDLANEKWAEEVYRFFGLTPYWEEGELSKKRGESREEPKTSYDDGGP